MSAHYLQLPYALLRHAVRQHMPRVPYVALLVRFMQILPTVHASQLNIFPTLNIFH